MPLLIPPYEKPIYDRLAVIHHALVAIKNNRSHYISSPAVYLLYEQFLDALGELKVSRKDEELRGLTVAQKSPTDQVVDDTWQLLLLCFMTCGLNKFAPATYSSLLTVHKMLDHLKEGRAYTEDDLAPIVLRLAEIRSIIDTNCVGDDETPNETHRNEENLLLRTKLQKCELLCEQLQRNFHSIPSDLEPVYLELVDTRKQILKALTDLQRQRKSLDRSLPESHTSDPAIQAQISHFKQVLKEISKKRDSDGKFHTATPSSASVEHAVQVVLNGMLDDCADLLDDMTVQTDTGSLAAAFESLSVTQENVSPAQRQASTRLDALVLKLCDIKSTLQNLLVTSRWTMRETDLYVYSKMLKEVDDERKFILELCGLAETSLEASRHIRKNHLLLLYLLRRCYALVYKLLEASESVSEALQPLLNQLTTVRRCLLEIKRVDGFNNMRELYPFQFKLASVDNMRKNGVFYVDGQIPEGQGTLNALLAECFDIMHELHALIEDREDAGQLAQDNYGGDFTNAKMPSRMPEAGLLESMLRKHNDSVDDADADVEQKRNRFHGFGEADYDQESLSAFDDYDDDIGTGNEYDDDDDVDSLASYGNDYY